MFFVINSNSTNFSLQKRKEKAICSGQHNFFSIYTDRAKNAELWDVDGKHYIDFSSGVAVTNTGHLHPEVFSAIKDQLEHFSHTCFLINPYEVGVRLAETLNEIVPIKKAKSAFSTTGAEAIENALKIAKYYTSRSGIIAFHGGFHGRTHMCIGLTGKVSPYKVGFGPMPGEIYHVPFPIDYYGISVADSLKALEDLFKFQVDSQRIGAIVVEIVQGEGGFYKMPDGFLKNLRDFCDTYGIVLIVDEIQTAFARTGKMFATEYHDVEPDLIVLSKGLGGGIPISAVVGKEHIMDSLKAGALGGTYICSPLGCASALAVIDVIKKEKLCESAIKIGEKIVKKLIPLQKRFSQSIAPIRNLGAMVALEFVKNGSADHPHPQLVKDIISKAAEKGLIILPCGRYGNVIRFLTPLTIGDDLLQKGLDIFVVAASEVLIKD